MTKFMTPTISRSKAVHDVQAIALALLGVGLLVAPLACTVGEGTGAAKGKLYLKNCEGTAKVPTGDLGSLLVPADFNLNPNFFVGEPIEDIKPMGSDNRLVIRMQDAGKRVEDNDVIVFDMDSFRVAECVRGVAAVVATPALQRFCAFDAAKGWPRLRVGPGFPVRASMALRKSCPGNPYVVASARGTSPGTEDATSDKWDSWIELREFGEAAVRSSGEDVKPAFKVEFGERLFADSFHLELIDDKTLRAELDKSALVIPEPDVKGSVDGFFDFLLERGQGAQTFP
jgi:hypothetical protein